MRSFRKRGHQHFIQHYCAILILFVSLPGRAMAAEKSDWEACMHAPGASSNATLVRDTTVIVSLSLIYTALKTEPPDLTGESDVCQIEAYFEGGFAVTAYWVMQPRSPQRIQYYVSLQSDSGTGVITLSSSDDLNLIASELDETNLGRGRLFHLDLWGDGRLELIELFLAQPSYPLVKRYVRKYLEGEVSPLVAVTHDGKSSSISISPEILKNDAPEDDNQ